jgi:hypothetical protein
MLDQFRESRRVAGTDCGLCGLVSGSPPAASRLANRARIVADDQREGTAASEEWCSVVDGGARAAVCHV